MGAAARSKGNRVNSNIVGSLCDKLTVKKGSKGIVCSDVEYHWASATGIEQLLEGYRSVEGSLSAFVGPNPVRLLSQITPLIGVVKI